MTKAILFAGALALSTLVAAPAFAQTASSPSAMADPARPAADVAHDAMRKPAEVLAFARIKPGDTVVELIPGGGYFTRILSKAVGPSGKVVAASPSIRDMDKPAKAIAADPAYGNVTVVGFQAADVAAWPKADVMFTAQNYHDFHLTMAHLDVAAIDRLLFSAVKPGGYLIVEDHVAATGAPVVETADKLHRIDPVIARRELEAAGFVFDGESDILRNPADDHSKVVFDPAIRGKTDQFLYRFKKPA
jgi:predicted methyltransferase